MYFLITRTLFAFLLLVGLQANANEGPNFVQSQDVVFAEVHGTGLLMDVFTPTGPANGKAIVDIASDPNAKNKLDRQDTSVAAVAVFFPPTDFLEWRDGKMVDLKVLGPLLAVSATSAKEGALNGKSNEELQAMAKAISPLYQVGKPTIPFLFIHGDADEVVPLSHSQKLVKAIQSAGGSAKLIVKEGGGHPWLTLPVEVGVMADWFDKELQ